jgi:hypothetical protein
VRESGSFDVPEDIRGLISRLTSTPCPIAVDQVDALPPRCGSIERRSAARRHAGIKVLLATPPSRGPGQLAGSGQSVRPRSATGPGEADFRRHSPNAGEQSPAHLLGIFGVAGQFGAQCAVLDNCSPDEERHSEGAECRGEP